MENIAAAIIGGVFSLLGVWLGHYLQNRPKVEAGRAHDSAIRLAGDMPAAPTLVGPQGRLVSKTVSEATKQSPNEEAVRKDIDKSRNLMRGIYLLLADLFLLFIVLGMFFHPPHVYVWWENYFAFFFMGVFPVYAIYLIISGIYYLIRKIIRRRSTRIQTEANSSNFER